MIILALATHELHFTVLRVEVPLSGHPQCCGRCDQWGHKAYQCEKSAQQVVEAKKNPRYLLLHVNVLREYLRMELTSKSELLTSQKQQPSEEPQANHVPTAGISSKFDFERMLDDWILLCFFVGNDFLPHLPTMKIRDGAIDMIINIYKKNLDDSGDYLTSEGQINFSMLNRILADFATVSCCCCCCCRVIYWIFFLLLLLKGLFIRIFFCCCC